jgi:hypothetical protein
MKNCIQLKHHFYALQAGHPKTDFSYFPEDLLMVQSLLLEQKNNY